MEVFLGTETTGGVTGVQYVEMEEWRMGIKRRTAYKMAIDRMEKEAGMMWGDAQIAEGAPGLFVYADRMKRERDRLLQAVEILREEMG